MQLPTTIDRIEDELEREVRDMIDRHPIFRQFAPKTRQNMARGASWGAIRVLTPDDFNVVSLEQKVGMNIQDEANRIVGAMTNVERMAPTGSHEHEMYMKDALFQHWPHIRAILITIGQRASESEK